MIPQLDITDTITISATEYGTDRYNYSRTDRYYAIVEELSLATDSDFRSNGEFRGKIKDRPFTAENQLVGGVSPLGNITVNFEGPFKPVLRPGEKVDLDFKVSSGTATVQVYLLVTLVTEKEMERLIDNGHIADAGVLN